MRQEHKYRGLTPDEYSNLFSGFLIDSWSFSKVSSFARNEKAFEMTYIYRQPIRSSASQVSGEAYHAALDHYFTELKDGVKVDLVALEKIAFDYIDGVKPNKWKIQKTADSVDACIKLATDTCGKLLRNFLECIAVYESKIKEVVEVEYYANEFLTVNGVDIPLPCNMRIDLLVKTTDDKMVIIDHKSKATYTDEKELKFSIGKQAITYALGYEAGHEVTIDEVWFMENKHSKNSDKSPQLHCFEVSLDKDTRRLYEAMLYEPLKRMLEAISSPDYVYLINEADNFVDKAEIYEFWAQTMIAEVEDFDIPETKVELIKKRLKKIRDASLATINPKTIKRFRENASEFIQFDLTNKNMTKEEKIEHTLRHLGVTVKIAHKLEGYSSETFLLEMSAGISVQSIYKHRLDIASALNVPTVRMNKNLYVHEGKSYVSVEAAKAKEKDLIFDAKYLEGTKIPLGFDNFGNKIIWNIENPSTPHMLVGGSTGSGKSVFIKSIIEYALLMKHPHIIILDPKYEFVAYRDKGVKVITDILSIEKELEFLVEKMQFLSSRNQKDPYLVIFDEFADAIDQSRKGAELDIKELVKVGTYKNGAPKEVIKKLGQIKSLDENLKMLLQKGRSSGFRILVATQRASVDVINGSTKVNLTVQVCFRMQKEIDSMVMIDEPGAEALTGNGDGLIRSPEYGALTRFQAFYKP